MLPIRHEPKSITWAERSVEYGRETGVPTPCYATMANLVKAVEDKYLGN